MIEKCFHMPHYSLIICDRAAAVAGEITGLLIGGVTCFFFSMIGLGKMNPSSSQCLQGVVDLMV